MMRFFISSLMILALAGCGGGGGDASLDGDDGDSGSSLATLQSIEITADPVLVAAGEKTTLHAVGRFSDGSVVDISKSGSSSATRSLTSLAWKASPSDIASFSSASSNELQTSMPGKVTITATDFFSGKVGTLTLVVTAPVSRSLSISGLTDGQTISSRTAKLLTANILNTDDSTQAAKDVIWSSSNSSIASVDSNGNFKAGQPGTVTISASSEGFTKAIKLTVVTAQATPTFKVSCDSSSPTMIDAALWGSKFSGDRVNATEWVTVDGASCQTYATVMLVIPNSYGLYSQIFYAERDPANPANFQPGTTYGSGSSVQFKSGQKITVGASNKLGDIFFTPLYDFTAQ
jgi:hypothetical protein